MATELLSTDWQPENFVDTTLTSDITADALDIFLDNVPTQDEGTLVIDPDSADNREIIYYSSKTATKVVCPANGRGYDNTTNTTHTAGTRVIMAPIADWFNTLKTLFTTTPEGWTATGVGVSSVAYNGNRSYDLTFSSTMAATLSAGMRLRTTRSAAAPTQCTHLNGSDQYFNDTSVSGMTFTDDFVVSAWVKLDTYNGTNQVIASRYNGTSGWRLNINSVGAIVLTGFNAGAANFSQVISYQAIPLGRWVHIAAQLDMSAFTATTTTSYVMIDGLDVPAQVLRGGTNPTALVQAGNLDIGANNSSGGAALYFDGKIAQVAIYSAKVTQANIRATISQGLTGSETSLISAYSFNNSLTDLNTGNANNLTAQLSATATNADSPFGGQADNTISSTLDYGIITKVATTTVTVLVAEGCTIPTTGGVDTASYSTQKAPYGMPVQRDKWRLTTLMRTTGVSQGSATDGTWYNIGSFQLTLPVGEWLANYQVSPMITATTKSLGYITLSTANNSESNADWSVQFGRNASESFYWAPAYRQRNITASSQTTYYLNMKQVGGSTVTISITDVSPAILEAECAYV